MSFQKYKKNELKKNKTGPKRRKKIKVNFNVINQKAFSISYSECNLNSN